MQLSNNFDGDEILFALKGMNPTKAPGLDGFQALFYEQTWDVTRPVVTYFVKQIVTTCVPKGDT